MVAAFLGACVAADEDDPSLVADFGSAAIQQPGPDGPELEELGREAARFYRELAARLDERGVTIEEMQAAVDAGDAERVRELFGFTPEEFAAANARAMDLAYAIESAAEDEPGPIDPDGLQCNGSLRSTFECGLMVAGWAYAAPTYAIGIFVVGGAYCALRDCQWRDKDGSKAPRTKKK